MRRIALIILVLGSALKTANSQNASDFILGKIETIQSAGLSESRILNIYLPDGYTNSDTTKYPVIYLLDGSADEDFIHIAGLMQFGSFPWVKMIEPSILVGIANVDRQRDFTYPTTLEKDRSKFPTAGGSEKFIRFIETEVQPFISDKYRTNGTETLIGQSLGGLLATEILFKKPSMFDKYIIVSPSLWWDNESLLKQQFEAVTRDNNSVFIAVGKEGKRMEKDAKLLYKTLKRLNVKRLDFQYFEKEDHATILHNAVYAAFLNWKSR